MAGDDVAAERILREGYAAVTEVGDEHSTKNVAWRLGLALARQGRYDDAEPFVAIARDTDQQSFWVAVWWQVVLARIEAHRGAVTRVGELVHAVRERTGLVAMSGMHADVFLECAEALREAGHDDEAATLVGEASTIADRLGYVVARRRADAAQRASTT